MTRETIHVTGELYSYLLRVSLREHEVLRRLRDANAGHPLATLQISPEQGQFLAFLLRMLDARKVIEVGVFMGYGTLWMALNVPEDGKVIACDINEEWTGIARRYWKEAGVEERIDLRLAPARQTLDALVAGGESGSFDLVFIDADKTAYLYYYERSLELLRPGGVIAVDNVLWSGRVLDVKDTDPDTIAIRQFNERLSNDERVDLIMLPIADGVTLARKR
ncbi:MAG: class I SAM-dependent methyltransferase [Gammaproteobacteria bacterium]|nr:class I SAM-dependent methyltransferase [Gammaproteobacteria bacterium]